MMHQVSQFATEFIRRKEGKPPSTHTGAVSSAAVGATSSSNASTANGGFQTTTKKKKAAGSKSKGDGKSATGS